MLRSRSSVRVSPVQPPQASIAALFQTPAVPLNEMGRPRPETRLLLHGEMAVQQKSLARVSANW